MASTFLTAQRISSLAVELLTRQIVLPGTVSRISGTEFAGDNGDTVTLRVQQPGTARKQLTPGAAITYDDITEVPVEVSLTHLYHATKVTDEALSMTIQNFGSQVTRIQTDAVARGAEDELADVMNGLLSDVSIATNGSNIRATFLDAREALSVNDVPTGDRWVAISPSITTMLLNLAELTQVDMSGTAQGLRDAVVGRYLGFNIVETNALDAGKAVFYHRTGFAFTMLPPAVPRGAADSAITNEKGIGLRQIFQYDPDHLTDRSVVSTFAGAGLVDADRVFVGDTGES